MTYGLVFEEKPVKKQKDPDKSRSFKIFAKLMVSHDFQKYPVSLLTGIWFCNTFGVLIVAKHL